MSEEIPYRLLASNPSQYDTGEVDWSSEGAAQHFTRKMLFEAISPHIVDIKGQSVLDVGSGQGWLCDELTKLGAHTVGIEPSGKNIEAAMAHYPDLDFRKIAFEDFTSKPFDLITALMVFEHFVNLKEAFLKAKTLLKQTGRMLVITGDLDRFSMSRYGIEVDVQYIREGEVATRTDYGERAGVLYDIFRTPERFKEDAGEAGLELTMHEPYVVPKWVLDEKPHYELFEGKPLFQLLGFEIAK